MRYQVYCDDNLVFHSRLEEYQLSEAKLELELNKAGAFTFEVHPSNPNFDKLHKLKSVITVYQDGELIFRGRIFDEEQGFYDNKMLVCEGELAFLLDSIIRPFNSEASPFKGTPKAFLEKMINEHNSQQTSDTWKHFKVGNVTVTGNVSVFKEDYNTPFDLINSELINQFGGYLWTRHEADGTYIDYLTEADFTELSNQPIKVGKNILDLKRSVKGDDVVTAIIPLGGQSDSRIDIKGVNGNKDYLVNTEAVEQYGFILKVVTFEDITSSATLKEEGQKYLDNIKSMYTTYEWTAMDLAGIENVNPFRLGQKIRVDDMLHGIDTTIFVCKLSLNLLRPTDNKLEAGASLKTFTQTVTKGQEKAAKNVAQTTVGKAMAGAAKKSDLEAYVQKEALTDIVYQSDLLAYVTLEEFAALQARVILLETRQ